MLATQAGGPGFDPHVHVACQVWWCEPAILAQYGAQDDSGGSVVHHSDELQVQ